MKNHDYTYFNYRKRVNEQSQALLPPQLYTSWFLFIICLLFCGCSHSSRNRFKVTNSCSMGMKYDSTQMNFNELDTLKLPNLGFTDYILTNKKGHLYSAYSNFGTFRYIANSNGDWRYVWGVDEITGHNDSISIMMGIEKFIFHKDVDFNLIDTIYNPFPSITQWIEKEYTIKRKGTVFGRLCIEMTYPKSKINSTMMLRNWLSSIISNAINNTEDNRYYKVNNNNPISILDYYFNIYRKNYNADNPVSDSTTWIHWDKNILLSLRWLSTDNNLLTFYIAQDNYTGGAHGYYTRQYATIDLSHHRHLTFNDIIKTDKRRFVRLLLLHKMKEEYYKGRITETDNDYLLYLCGEEDIKRLFNDVNSQEALDYMIDNFPMYEPAITPYGLVFYYNPYDIDCFAGGNKLYIVTYKELKNCITKDYKISINNYYEE